MLKKLVLVALVLVIGFVVVDRWSRSKKPYVVQNRRPHSESKRNIATSTSSVRPENPKSNSPHRVEQWMSDYDGSIFEFEYQVKELLDDPSSFEHVETSYLEQGLDAKVRMKFRATNKLGAKVLNQADAILNTNDGTVSNITIK